VSRNFISRGDADMHGAPKLHFWSTATELAICHTTPHSLRQVEIMPQLNITS